MRWVEASLTKFVPPGTPMLASARWKVSVRGPARISPGAAFAVACASAISVPCSPIRRKALIRTYGMPDRKPPRPDWPAAGARTEQKM